MEVFEKEGKKNPKSPVTGIGDLLTRLILNLLIAGSDIIILFAFKTMTKITYLIL